MADFTPITTQEELDAIISERLKRERETSAKRFEGWTSPEDLEKLNSTHAAELKKLQDAAANDAKKLAEKDAELAKSAQYKTDLEKTRIALAAGLKIDYADRLRGENAEEWKKDAELLAKDFKTAQVLAPLGDPDPKPGNNDPELIAKAKFKTWLDEFNAK